MIKFTIFGQAYSKANSRKLVTINGRLTSVKSEKALAFERDALRQIPPACRVRLEGLVAVTLRMFYASERPDLDESLVLDVLQDRFGKLPPQLIAEGKPRPRPLVQSGVYRNDRQVREKHVFHAIDKRNPRVEIEVVPVQESLL